MAKTIAVWGSPNSGKTTFATKLARAIYDEDQSTVSVVYADMETPALPVIFPNYKKEDLYRIEKGIKEGCGVDAPGSLVSYLCEQIPVYALDIKDGIRYDIGTLESYEEVKRIFAAKNK